MTDSFVIPTKVGIQEFGAQKYSVVLAQQQ
jgi:hypothetical protein